MVAAAFLAIGTDRPQKCVAIRYFGKHGMSALPDLWCRVGSMAASHSAASAAAPHLYVQPVLFQSEPVLFQTGQHANQPASQQASEQTRQPASQPISINSWMPFVI